MRAAKPVSGVWRRAKGARNVARPGLWCQLRLCTRRARARQHIGPVRYAPSLRQASCKKRALIVAPLALPGGVERHADHCRAFFDHVVRPVEPRHSVRHADRHGLPSAVLERVHNVPRAAARNPAHAAERAHPGWKLRTQAARIAIRRVTATFAARPWQGADPRPTSATDGTRISRVEQPQTRDAGRRKEHIEKGTARGADGGRKITCGRRAA